MSEFDIVVRAASSGGDLSDAQSVTGVSDATVTGVSTFSVQNSGALSDESGIVDVTLTGVPLVGSGAIATSALPSNVADGESDTTTLDYAVAVTATSASGAGSASVTPNGSFDVTLNNDAGSTTATGTINTNGTSE